MNIYSKNGKSVRERFLCKTNGIIQNSCHRVELLRVKALGRNYSVIVPVTVKLDMSVLEMSGVDCTDLIIASSLRTHLSHRRMTVMILVLALKCNEVVEVVVEPAQNNHVELPQASSHTKNMAIKASNNLFFSSSKLFWHL